MFRSLYFTIVTFKVNKYKPKQPLLVTYIRSVFNAK